MSNQDNTYNRSSAMHRGKPRLHNIVNLCNGRPRGQELPQVATEHDIIIELLHDCTGVPLDELQACHDEFDEYLN